MIATPLSPAHAAFLPAPAEWPALATDEGAELSLVVRAAGMARARCSLWWSDVPPLEGERLGVIGHFGAADAEAARVLLDTARDELARRGCTLAVGPMDGNTWRRYRLVVEAREQPPFFLEPTNPAEWPGWWEGAGFAPLAHYFSALNEDLARRDPRVAEVAPRLAANGVTVRPIDPARFDEELARIYEVAAVSFRENYLYTPLPREAFAAQYQKVREFVVPALVLIAEQGERPVGFAFSIPDLHERMRGEAPRTVIVKTIAILPERRLLGGLGSLMTDRTQATAHAMGFTRAIHALMHESNQSRNISARTATTMRRYALFGRRVAGAEPGQRDAGSGARAAESGA